MDDEVIERLAQAIHARYLAEQLAAGVALGTTPAMRGWDELDEDKRDANRAQARAIPATLARVGCTVGPAGPVTFAFTPAQLESLARGEHDRWCLERRAAGWSFGDTRDDLGKHSPLLVAWEQLAEAEREKDRDAIRRIPAVLQTVDLAVVPA